MTRPDPAYIADPASSILEPTRVGYGLWAIVGEPGSGRTYALGLIERHLRPEVSPLVLRGESPRRATAFSSVVRSPLHAQGRAAQGPLDARSREALIEAEGWAEALRGRRDALAVLADDPESLDEASAHLLSILSRDRRRQDLIVTTRSGVDVPSTGGLDGVIELAPLSEEGLFEILSELKGPEIAAHLRPTLEGAGGNPGLALAAADQLRYLLHRGRSSDVPPRGEVVLPIAAIPHLRGANDGTIELLRQAAIIGATFDPLTLSIAVDVEASAASAKLGEASRLRLLEDRGGVLRFRHPWVQRTLYSSWGEAVARALHRHFADRLAADGSADPGVVAAQLLLAGGRHDQDVVWLRRAATDALGRQPAQAVAFLERAAAIAGPAHGDIDQIEAERVLALLALGRSSEASAIARRILARGTATGTEVVLRLALSQALLYEDDLGASVAQLEAAAGGDRIDRRAANRVLAEKSLRHVLSGELAIARTEAETAVRTASSLGDEAAMSSAYGALAHAAYYEGRLREAVDLARSAVRCADAATDDAASRRSRYELGMFLLHADDLGEAELVFRAELQRADEAGVVWYSPIHHYGLGFCGFYSGDWVLAEREFRCGLELVAQAETRWESSSARAHLAVMAVARGGLREAEDLLAEPVVSAKPSSVSDASTSAAIPHDSRDARYWARAHLSLARGDAAQALHHLQVAAASVVESGALIRLRWLVPDLVRVAMATDGPAAAMPVLRRLEEIADLSRVPYVLAASLRSRALVERDQATVSQALDLYRASNRVVDLADCLEDAGLLAQESGEAAVAIDRLDEAADLYDRIGATAHAARVRSTLRALGVRRRQNRRRATSGWESLTETERRVATLAGSGKTNAEMAALLVSSPRTVETHLRHIYEKLEIGSRVELATHLATRPAADS